jgi:hypothetical protein
VFGGLLWPIAWLWTYTKPVLYKLAYGTDVDESIGHHDKAAEAAVVPQTKGATVATGPAADGGETANLRARIAELEKQLMKIEGGQS